MKRLLIAVLAVLSMGACGGQDAAEATADCMSGFNSVYDSASAEIRQAVPRSAWEESGRQVCRRAVEEGVVEGGESDEEIAVKMTRLVKRYPEVMHPICVASALSEFRGLAPGEQTPELQSAFQEFGRRYCDAAIREGVVSLERVPTDEEINDLFQRNPSITTEVCVVGGLRDIQADPMVVRGKVVSQAHAKVFFTRFCREAAEAGLFTVTEDFTPAQQHQLGVIFARVRRELVSSGQLP